MEPWEIMISESQERMVAVVRPQMLDAVRAVCARWELPCTPIGEVTDARRAARVLRTARSSARSRRACSPTSARATRSSRRKPDSLAARGAQPLSDANRADKRWIYEQYDQLVGSRTVRRPGLDAARAAAAPVAARPRRRARRARARRARPVRAPACRRCSAPRATSRAPAASRSGSPTASTSATPRSRRSRYELAQAIEGIAQRGGGARHPGRLGQRVALQRDRRPLDPADAGRRLRRARRRRAARPGRVAVGRRRAARAGARGRASPPRPR